MGIWGGGTAESAPGPLSQSRCLFSVWEHRRQGRLLPVLQRMLPEREGALKRQWQRGCASGSSGGGGEALTARSSEDGQRYQQLSSTAAIAARRCSQVGRLPTKTGTRWVGTYRTQP